MTKDKQIMYCFYEFFLQIVILLSKLIPQKNQFMLEEIIQSKLESFTCIEAIYRECNQRFRDQWDFLSRGRYFTQTFASQLELDSRCSIEKNLSTTAKPSSPE